MVFAEASLASVNLRLQRQRRVFRQLAVLVTLAVLLGVGALWGYAFVANREMVAALDKHVAQYDEAEAAIPAGPVSDVDFPKIVPVLDQLTDGYAILDRPDLKPLRLLGLNQADKLRGEYTDTYVRALDHLMLPRVLVLLQNQLRARADDADFQFDALKVYLGLGNQGPIDKAFTARWLHTAWEAAFPAPEQAALRADLDRHFAAMLDHPLPTVTLDATLLAGTRQAVTQRPLAQRTYALIRDGAAARALPGWRPLDKTGAVGQRVFYRQSGKPLTEAIPGFFTRAGYFGVLLPQMSEAIEQARKEGWVYGSGAPVGESNDMLAPQIIALYRNDFDTQWRTVLGDIRVVRFGNVDQAVQVLNALSGPSSALRKLLTAVADDTDLSPPPADTKDPAELNTLRLTRQYATGPSAPTDTFGGLREAVHSQNGAVGETVRSLDTLYNQLSRAADTSGSAAATSTAEANVSDAVQGLVSDARRMPTPSDAWMLSLSNNVTAISSGSVRSKLSTMWAQSGGRFCQRAVGENYPFVRGARSDISLDDFDKLFAPGGVFDKFVETSLKPYINQSSSPWQWQYAGTRPASSAALSQFERAASIRQAFYNPNSTRLGRGGGARAGGSLDAAATGVTLEFGDQIAELAARPGAAHHRASGPPPRAAGTRGSRSSRHGPSGGSKRVRPVGAVPPVRLARSWQPLSRDSSTATFSHGRARRPRSPCAPPRP